MTPDLSCHNTPIRFFAILTIFFSIYLTNNYFLIFLGVYTPSIKIWEIICQTWPLQTYKSEQTYALYKLSCTNIKEYNIFFSLNSALKSHVFQRRTRGIKFFIGPRSPGPIYVPGLSLSEWETFVNLTDVTLADEDTDLILPDNTKRAIQGNLAMQLTQPGRQLWNQCKWRNLMKLNWCDSGWWRYQLNTSL